MDRLTARLNFLNLLKMNRTISWKLYYSSANNRNDYYKEVYLGLSNFPINERIKSQIFDTCKQ